MIENFFIPSFDKKEYHEILIIIELKFIDNHFYNKETIYNIEEKKKNEIEYIWLNIKDLKNSNFQQKIIVDLINKKQFWHYINK